MKNFEIKNGVLYEDGKAVLSIGVSYYASYHPQKVPLLEGMDREGEMKKDLKAISEAGFNTVRCAALGTVKYNEKGEVEASFPFIDQMLEEAEKNDLSFNVRLQGYTMILGDYKDGLMMNERNEYIPDNPWWFLQNCPSHPLVRKDNYAGTYKSAEHFAKFKNVVAYQMYNEPAYPQEKFINTDIEFESEGIYDYNPYQIKAYMEKYNTDKEPPRVRPYENGDIEEWINWRTFNMDAMTDFLVDVAKTAKKAAPNIKVFTNQMPDPIQLENSCKGEDYYRVCEGMDMLTLTHYIPFDEEHVYHALIPIDCIESVASKYNKTAWTVECNARTAASRLDIERQIYAIIGGGHKGMHFYQWRGDYPIKKAPEPQMYGIVWSDGTPSPNYDIFFRINKMLNSVSTEFAEAKKIRSGCAILYSSHRMFYEDGKYKTSTKTVEKTEEIYKFLRQKSLNVDFVRAIDLEENSLNVKDLFIPFTEGLTDEELKLIEAFKNAGGRVYYDISECNLEAFIKGTDGLPIDVRLFESGNENLAVIINYSDKNIEKPFTLSFKNDIEPKNVTLIDTYGDRELSFKYENKELSFTVDKIGAGCFIRIK